jgi:16S rRNA (cytidine1402-2'-O)-methyltransferase
MLFLVPTPIGNLEDITLRAIRILKESTFILAEDTRTSKKLLDYHGISTPLRPFHAFNEHQVTENLVKELAGGISVSLISDAGTPGISDPGFLLVRACIRANIEITCLPGATALIPALAASGLPTDSFHFEGFLPHKKGRQTRLKYIAELIETSVIYESPHRLVKLIDELCQIGVADRKACVCRELSKWHETFHRGTIIELQAYFKEHPDQIRGEIVFLLEGKR